MKIISDALNEKLLEMAKGNKELSDLLQISNEETFSYSPFKRTAYWDLLDQCRESVKEIMREMDSEMTREEAALEVENESLSQLIADNMPEQAGLRFEIAMSNDFDHYSRPDGDVADDDEKDLSVYVRSWIDENLRLDLKEELKDLWDEVQEENEED